MPGLGNTLTAGCASALPAQREPRRRHGQRDHEPPANPRPPGRQLSRKSLQPQIRTRLDGKRCAAQRSLRSVRLRSGRARCPYRSAPCASRPPCTRACRWPCSSTATRPCRCAASRSSAPHTPTVAAARPAARARLGVPGRAVATARRRPPSRQGHLRRSQLRGAHRGDPTRALGLPGAVHEVRHHPDRTVRRHPAPARERGDRLRGRAGRGDRRARPADPARARARARRAATRSPTTSRCATTSTRATSGSRARRGTPRPRSARPGHARPDNRTAHPPHVRQRREDPGRHHRPADLRRRDAGQHGVGVRRRPTRGPDPDRDAGRRRLPARAPAVC